MNTTTQILEVDLRDAFFNRVYDLASNDKDIIFLAADMGAFALNKFRQDFARQYINVGISEQNLVSVSAGLALSGKKTFIYAITPFVTQRCYEQIKVDICGMKLHVIIVGSGPGITYASDGPTHHAIQDIAIMRSLPELTIYSPSDPTQACSAADFSYQSIGPVYIRLNKGKFPLLYQSAEEFSEGASVIKTGSDVTIISTGVIVHRALQISKELSKNGLDVGVIDLFRIKPVNEKMLLETILRTEKIVTFEEHFISGGIGTIICEILAKASISKPIKNFAIYDSNLTGYGDKDWMYNCYGLSSESICKAIVNWKS